MIAHDIAAVQAALTYLDNETGLGGMDAALVNQRRKTLRKFKGTLEAELTTGVSKTLVCDEADCDRGDGPPDDGYTPAQPEPPCVLNGNLNGCFMDWWHDTKIDGTGFITQLTSMLGSQSAHVTILVDATAIDRSIGTVGLSISSKGLSKTYSFPAPDCNARSHTVSST